MGSGAPWPLASWLTAGWPGNSLGWQQAGQAGAGAHVVHHIPACPWPEEQAGNTARQPQGWGLRPPSAFHTAEPAADHEPHR